MKAAQVPYQSLVLYFTFAKLTAAARVAFPAGPIRAMVLGFAPSHLGQLYTVPAPSAPAHAIDSSRTFLYQAVHHGLNDRDAITLLELALFVQQRFHLASKLKGVSIGCQSVERFYISETIRKQAAQTKRVEEKNRGGRAKAHKEPVK